MTLHSHPKLFRVLADYEVNDRHPLRAQPGDAATILHTDSTWPGWAWIETLDTTGWAPLSHLQSSLPGTTRFSKPFDGTELSAQKDAVLTAIAEESGWIFAQDAQLRRGWFPLFNLRPLRS